MTANELAKRVEQLEKAVQDLTARFAQLNPPKEKWWESQAGRFANDPVFDDIVRLGKEYRESLRPGKKKKAKNAKAKVKVKSA